MIQSFVMRYCEDISLLQSNTHTPPHTRAGFTCPEQQDDTVGGKVTVLQHVESPVHIKGLPPGRTYYCQVYASNQFGPGEWSDVSEAMTTDPSVPEPPGPN